MSDIKMIAMGCKPDPTNFTIQRLEHYYGSTIIEAVFHGCESFEGKKLMLLKGIWNKEDFETLDPHFLDEDYAVVARFIPNKMGWSMAVDASYTISILERFK